MTLQRIHPWSSYHHNALGQTDSFITEHQLYKALGDDDKQCCESHKNMFARLNSAEQESQISQTDQADDYPKLIGPMLSACFKSQGCLEIPS